MPKNKPAAPKASPSTPAEGSVETVATTRDVRRAMREQREMEQRRLMEQAERRREEEEERHHNLQDDAEATEATTPRQGHRDQDQRDQDKDNGVVHDTGVATESSAKQPKVVTQTKAHFKHPPQAASTAAEDPAAPTVAAAPAPPVAPYATATAVETTTTTSEGRAIMGPAQTPNGTSLATAGDPSMSYGAHSDDTHHVCTSERDPSVPTAAKPATSKPNSLGVTKLPSTMTMHGASSLTGGTPGRLGTIDSPAPSSWNRNSNQLNPTLGGGGTNRVGPESRASTPTLMHARRGREAALAQTTPILASKLIILRGHMADYEQRQAAAARSYAHVKAYVEEIDELLNPFH